MANSDPPGHSTFAIGMALLAPLKSHSWPTSADGRAGQGADICAGFWRMPVAASRQFVEQRFGLFQVGGIEAFGKPAINRGEKVVCFGASILVAAEPSEAHSGAQFP